MKWWWSRREEPRPAADEYPTLDDLAKATRQVEESKARLDRTDARSERVDRVEAQLRHETRVNHLGPTIAKALRTRGTT